MPRKKRYIICDYCSQEFLRPELAKDDEHYDAVDIGSEEYDWDNKCVNIMCAPCCREARRTITETFG